MKAVAADGTMNTLAPTRADDSQIPGRLGRASGSAAPAASTSIDAVIGHPSCRPLNTPFHSQGASSVMLPSTVHMMEVVAASDKACAGLWRSHATIKVM